MIEETNTLWEPVCNIPFRGLLVETNFDTEENMLKNLKKNANVDILFISSNDGSTPTSYQGFNLIETIELRNYLTNLINIAKKAI